MSDPEVITLDDTQEVTEDDDDEDSNVPDVKICQERVTQFAEVTGTDEALAQFYLQDCDWDLKRSLDMYYATQGSDQVQDVPTQRNSGVKAVKSEEPELLVTFDSQGTSRPAGTITTEAPKDFRFLTWNIDGLDDHNLKKRTKAVAKILEEEKADIVFLQELIPDTFSYLETHLPQFLFIPGGDEDYFTATLLRRTTVYYDDHRIIPFNNSVMGRNLLHVEAHIGKLKLSLLNSHLESTAEFGEQRKEQMRIGFEKMRLAPKNITTIFGGDLNARDKEVDATRIPDAWDLWETCGKRPECKFTWDTQRNTNKQLPGKYKPKARFDRVYIKHSSPPILSPKHFGLAGIQKVSGTQSFPSDHWGIMVHFQVMN